ncbi:uncharacterized protein LOC110433682 [Sorghum bicolor]|uniref:uncharacterized protein LOC110433682 n=1 Tax=Sorghum bicolor TaxID=4558 RepID=UPI000B4255FA|nr:uncharacterized protein LOC110433682 [Sorghum bicolor]|eukprot:XP_021311868.1 uncharacterized protein LOC110433682 [Sorghum bicolor]
MEDKPTPNNYGDTTMLPFPTRERRKKRDRDEQFLRFMEMVEKTHVSVPLMDVLHISSYSKFIKDIINKKRPLPSTEVVKLTEEFFDRLNFTNLEPTTMTLQLADSSVRYPAGIAQDIPVKIRGYYVLVDFVVLNMELTKETLLILGRPFFSTAGA